MTLPNRVLAMGIFNAKPQSCQGAKKNLFISWRLRVLASRVFTFNLVEPEKNLRSSARFAPASYFTFKPGDPQKLWRALHSPKQLPGEQKLS
ncbi:MAG: hypothetical protein HYZ49_00590 [Chloroflexi bacterium]|nr:hypothetical protein [Chloroflexota bacterium]